LTAIALSARIFMNPKLQVLATKSFSRWMQKNKIAHQELFSAAAEMAQGLIDADLGAHVVKKRVPRISKNIIGIEHR
jgi:hypothetical protein